jgi:5-methylcytosine-specific restriction endonuclease McrA
MPGSKIRKTCGCGRPTMRHGINKNGVVTYKSTCTQCRTKARSYKKDNCQNCGISKEIAALEVDHIDGNRSNNKESNLQTLCTKCHIEKTIKNKDYLNRYE